jgi:hypothetical protein
LPVKNDFSRKPISLINSVKIIGRWWLCGNRRGHADRPKEASCGPAVDFDRIIVEVAHEKVPRACGLVLMGPLPAGRSLAASNDVGQQIALFCQFDATSLAIFPADPIRPQ